MAFGEGGEGIGTRERLKGVGGFSIEWIGEWLIRRKGGGCS